MIPQNIIESVISTAKIEDVIGDFLSLKKQGPNYLGCCPFHDEKTPSMVVSPAKGIFKCFGCGKGGNAVKFIEYHEQLTFPEALKFVAKKYNIDVPEDHISDEEKEKESRRSILFSVNLFAQKYYTYMCNEGSVGYVYLKDRGIDNFDIENFNLGYAKDGFTNFLSHAATKGYSPLLLKEAGLVSDKEGKYFDRYQERIIFPIHNLSGNIAGFTGRITKESTFAKYMNTPQTEVFNKSNLLYGLFQAKKSIVSLGRANIVEGNTDVISFHKKGITNTVATCGTSLTSSHAKMLKRFTKDVTIIFDADNAGQKATERGVEILAAEGLHCYVAILPVGEDPDSFARKQSKEELNKWIEKNEIDFILYLAQINKETIKNKPAEKGGLIKQILSIIEKMPDASTQEAYINDVSKIFETSTESLKKDILLQKVSNHKVFGLDINKDAIKSEKEVKLYPTREEAIEAISNGKTENIISAQSMEMQQIWELSALTKNVTVYNLPNRIFEKNKESVFVIMLKNMTIQGLNVKCEKPDCIEDYNDVDFISFVDTYPIMLHNNCDLYDNAQVNKVLDLIAQFLSQIDSTTRTRKAKEIGKLFNLDKGDFSKILQPYISKANSTKRQELEDVEIDGEKFVFNSDKLPAYVDTDYLRKYKHFAAENSKKQKIFYVFDESNGSLRKVSNFFMQPLFHVQDQNSDMNKRVVKLTHETGREVYVELPSKCMINMQTFRQFLWERGNFQFIQPKPYHLDMITLSIGETFREVNQLKIWGQQSEDFYAFPNAIITIDGEIRHMDNLGIVEAQDKKMYYSPAVSDIYKYQRKDDDIFEQERLFIFNEQNIKTDFNTWSSLMLRVYKYNNMGHWAVLYTILCAFRSEIFPISKYFTALFFCGPTGCGKSKIAESIRNVYSSPITPSFNLNFGSDAALNTLLGKNRDIPQLLEEYNDMQISDSKFQSLKAAVLDGEGKTKRKDAASTDLSISKVYAALILLGQESPQRDDGSLGNRCVLLDVKKIDNWSEQEKTDFNDLKEREKDRLDLVLLSILRQRKTIRRNYNIELKDVQKQMQLDLNESNMPFQPRILNTVTLLLTMCKVWEKYVSQFNLGFSYNEFYKIAKSQIVKQSETIMSSNRLAVFFDTLLYLANREHNGITEGKEYKIDIRKEIDVRITETETKTKQLDIDGTRVLFLRIKDIYPIYRDHEKSEHLKINNLMSYLKDHAAYLGNVKTETFTWEQIAQVETADGSIKNAVKQMKQRTSCVAFNYDKLGIEFFNTSIKGDAWKDKEDVFESQKDAEFPFNDE